MSHSPQRRVGAGNRCSWSGAPNQSAAIGGGSGGVGSPTVTPLETLPEGKMVTTLKSPSEPPTTTNGAALAAVDNALAEVGNVYFVGTAEYVR